MAKRKPVQVEIVEDEKILRPKQRRFVEEYVIDYNGTAAAIRAGYAPGGRCEIPLLKNPKVKAAIEKIEAKRSAENEKMVAEVIMGLYQITTDVQCPQQHRINAAKLFLQVHGRLKEEIKTDNTITINVADEIKEIGQ